MKISTINKGIGFMKLLIEETDRYSELLNLYNSNSYIDHDIGLISDKIIPMRKGNFAVDTVYVVRDFDGNIVLKGYAHNDDGEYDWDYLIADDITNADISPYMNGDVIIDFEGFLDYLKSNEII